MGEQLKVVAIGGGTGLAVLLKGLKKFTSEITAIVTVGDDGGGSGTLREDMGILPPGDIRNCIAALANAEPIMEKMLQYRFKEGNIKGQSLGNLIIAALTDVCGSFDEAVRRASEFFAVTGRVLPVTLDDMVLFAEFENGDIVEGESKIPKKQIELHSFIKRLYTKPSECEPLEDALTALREADIIILGPGSLYTSIIPNLLVKNMGKTIAESRATKVYIANVMTQPGETGGYDLNMHLNSLYSHCSDLIIDFVIVNGKVIPDDVLDRYRLDGANPIYACENFECKRGVKTIVGDLMKIEKGYIRHDYIELAKIVIELGKENLNMVYNLD